MVLMQSIISSNGIDQFEVIKDKYFEYDSSIYKDFHSLKEKIFHIGDLEKVIKSTEGLRKKNYNFPCKNY